MKNNNQKITNDLLGFKTVFIAVLAVIVVILFGRLISGRSLFGATVLIEKTSLINGGNDSPYNVAVPDFLLKQDRQVIFKKPAGGFRSKDYELYQAKLSANETRELGELLVSRGFFELRAVFGKESAFSPVLIEAAYGSKRNSVIFKEKPLNGSLAEIFTKFETFTHSTEKIYSPQKVSVYAIALSGSNAKNALKSVPTHEWTNSIKLKNFAGTSRDFEADSAAKVLADSGRETQVYFVEDGKVYQTFIKWKIE